MEYFLNKILIKKRYQFIKKQSMTDIIYITNINICNNTNSNHGVHRSVTNCYWKEECTGG